MRELSLIDISRLQESKKNIVNNLGLYKYLGGNHLIYDKFILSDPMSNTYIQIQNLDGTLDILSESMKVKNISVQNLSTLNKVRINDDITIKGSSTLQGYVHCLSNITTENSLISKNLNVSNDAILNNLTIDGVLKLQNYLQVDFIYPNSDTLNIGTNELNKEINIGNLNSIVSIYGTLKYKQLENEIIQNRELIINGISGCSQLLPVSDIGIYFSNGLNNKKGFFKTDGINGETFELKSPNSDFVLAFPKLNSNSSILIKNQDTKKVILENLECTEEVHFNNLEVLDFATFSNVNLNDLAINGNINLKGNFNSNILQINGDKVLTKNLFSDNLEVSECSIINSKINQAKINVLTCDNLESKISFIDKLKNTDAIIENGKISNIENESFTSKNSKITNLNVISLNVEKDVILANTITKKDSKIYGNQNILGNLEANKLNIKDTGKINYLTSINIETNNIKSNNIENNFIETKNIKTNELLVLSNIECNGFINFNRGYANNLNITKDLIVDNNSFLKNLYVKNDSKFNNILVDGSIFTTKDIELSGDLNASNIEVSKNMKINEKLNVINDTILNKDVFIRGTLSISQNVFVDNEFNCFNSNIKNDLSIGNNLSISGDLLVKNKFKSNEATIENLNIIKELQVKNLKVSENTELSNVIIKKGVKIQGDVFINEEPIINRKYIESISTTFTYLTLDGNVLINENCIKEGTYTYIVSSQILNKINTKNGSPKNIIYSLAVDNENNFYVGGYLSGSRVFSVWKQDLDKWIEFPNITGQIIDLIKIDNREHIYFVGDFLENGRIYEYIPKTNIWNRRGLDIDGKINTICFDSDNNFYIGGNFTKIGDRIFNHIAKYNFKKEQWEQLNIYNYTSIGLNNIVNCILTDNMDNLYVGGEFSDYLLKWNNNSKTWEKIIDLDKSVYCLSLDNNNNLYIGGRFKGSIIRYNCNLEMFEELGNSLLGDVKCISIDSINNVYIAINSAPFLYKWSETEKKWVVCIKNINGLILSMCFDKNDNLYIAGNFNTPFSKLIIYESDLTKTIRFNNLIKFVDREGKLIVSKKITFKSIADTISIKFEKNVGYVIYKSGGVSL